MILRAPEDGRFVHQALLYESTDEFVSATVPFLRDGARSDDVTVLVTSPRNLAAVRDTLEASQAASILFEPAGEHYARPSHALARYQRMLHAAVRSRRRVRAVGEPPLGTLPEEHIRELTLTDAAFNEVCRLPGVSVVCPYDLRAVPDYVVDAVYRSHPEVVEGGERRRSPRYTDASRILAEDRHGPPLPEPTGSVAAITAPENPAQVRVFVQEAAQRARLGPSDLGDFLTAVNEIVTNAFAHAIMGSVRVWQDGDTLVCEVRDRGPGLSDLLAGFRQPELEQTTGRGLWLARQLTDLLQVRTGNAGSTFRLHLQALPGGKDRGRRDQAGVAT